MALYFPTQPVNSCIKDFPRSYFHKRYKTIVSVHDSEYLAIQDWLSSNSNGSVEIKMFVVTKYNNEWVQCSPDDIGNIRPFVGFENEDDALFFKIKFSV